MWFPFRQVPSGPTRSGSIHGSEKIHKQHVVSRIYESRMKLRRFPRGTRVFTLIETKKISLPSYRHGGEHVGLMAGQRVGACNRNQKDSREAEDSFPHDRHIRSIWGVSMNEACVNHSVCISYHLHAGKSCSDSYTVNRVNSVPLMHWDNVHTMCKIITTGH